MILKAFAILNFNYIIFCPQNNMKKLGWALIATYVVYKDNINVNYVNI